MIKSKTKSPKKSVICLIIALVLVLIGGVLFIGAVSGWFDDQKTALDPEYQSETPELLPLNASEYDNLITLKKSFVIFVDQSGCTTADRLREYIKKYGEERKINVYRMMFSEVKESSLHQYVKYYPSVVIVNKGKVFNYLRADSDEDAAEYNDYDTFKTWLSSKI